MTQLAHVEHFLPGTNPSQPPLVLFHGSGGDEYDLAPLARELAPQSSALGIRGTVAIDGGFAFFHRRADRSIDEDDLDARIPKLAEFIATANVHHDLSRSPVAIGFSNGAITVAALLLSHPTLFSAAILFRPLSPYLEDRPATLDGKPVLIIDGEKDSRRSPGDGSRLADRLRRVGANVTHHILPCGHSITARDQQLARDWLRGLG
jgi:phospholipase/carboxylesterase